MTVLIDRTTACASCARADRPLWFVLTGRQPLALCERCRQDRNVSVCRALHGDRLPAREAALVRPR